jgi:NitT/TauT family transport system permease protein
MTRPLTPENQANDGGAWHWQDLLVLLLLLSVLVWLIQTAAEFNQPYNEQFQIDLNPLNLPTYVAQTLLRMLLGYGLSLLFSLGYGLLAYYNRAAGKILIPTLDILQSIPVLSFLPGVVLALIALFPGQRLGVELAAILLIFTGMAWNMTFSFYQSLQGVPEELREAARTYRLNRWQNFWTVDLPAGAIGLVWNSVMSVAGGWFFLIAIESFSLGDRSFRLPGLGSYLAVAASKGNFAALGWGLVVLLTIIILTDLLVWRPLIAWSEKFKFQMVESEQAPQSWLLDVFRRSPLIQALDRHLRVPLQRKLDESFTGPMLPTPAKASAHSLWQRWLTAVLLLAIVGGLLWGGWRALMLLHGVSGQEWGQLLMDTGSTTLRVAIALVLSLLWTVPVGVAIGRNPRLAQLLQPLVQIAASVPATALFPVLLVALVAHGGLQVGSILLMMLGTMWYILFNVIAGAQAIPSELFEAATVYRLLPWQRWQTVILPGIFPYLVTGIITAVGGAWNASIVSEFVQFRGETLSIRGLGAAISEASARGNYDVLLASTVLMSTVVVLTNRLVWRRLYQLGQEKYQLL